MKAPKDIVDDSDEVTESIGKGEDIDGAKFDLSLKIAYGMKSCSWFGFTKVKQQDQELLEFKKLTIEGDNAKHLTSRSDSDNPSSSVDSEALKQSIFGDVELDVDGHGTTKDDIEFTIHGEAYVPDGKPPHTQKSHDIKFKQRFDDDDEYTIDYRGQIDSDFTEIKGTFTTSEGKTGSFFLS